MTILEDLKAGRLVVVPREATGAAVNAAWHEGKSRRMTGLTNDFRAVLDSALAASPDHTAGLIALVEGMERERDGADAVTAIERKHMTIMKARAIAAEARALAAEAKVEALREALAPFGSGAVVFYENEPDDCVLSLGRWKYQEDGRARFYADVQFTVADVRRARALTQEQPNVGE